MTREITLKLYEAVEEGRLDWEVIGKEALCYLSEDDVADMVQHSQMLGDNDE